MQEDKQDNVSDGTGKRSFSMPAGMRIGPPVIRVRDVQGALSFYEGAFGLHAVKEGTDSEDGLELIGLRVEGSATDLLEIKEDSSAPISRISSAGLYHFAIRVPTRKSLGSALFSLSRSKVSFEGFADHTVSESLYLHDPEQNGIEIYADRGKETWKRFMQLNGKDSLSDTQAWMSLNKPLDLDSLLADIDKSANSESTVFPEGTDMGHMHLKVTDLSRSLDFYSNDIGLDITASVPSLGAAFLSAGGYHHHVGMNTWHTLGGSQRNRGETGLDSLTIMVPDIHSLDRLREVFPESPFQNGRLTIRDPDGMRITIRR